MNAKDAAYKVLMEAGEALHYKEISRRMLDGESWKSEGKTPAATVNAQLAVDIKKKGEGSRFKRAGKGIYTINTEQKIVEKTYPGNISDIKGTKPATMSFANAAVNVLERHADKKPMHYKDITKIALKENLVRTSGQTPEATMYAVILTDIKRMNKRGEQPRFLLAKGMISLSKWHGRGLHYDISEHNRKIRKDLLTHIRKIDAGDFEKLIGKLLTAIGFDDVEVTNLHQDGGIDVRGNLVVGDVIRTKMAVQAKRWKGNVGAPVIQQVRGSLGAHEQGLIITTSNFSRKARDEAERKDATPIGLMSGDQLVKLLVEYDIGVKRSDHKVFDLDVESLAVEGDDE